LRCGRCHICVIVPGGTVGKVFDIIANTMTRACVRTCSPGTAFTLKALKTGTLSGGTVAYTLTSTFHIFVELTKYVGIVYPGDFVGANSIRAVTSIMGKTRPEIVIALADIIGSTGTVATASIVAFGINAEKIACKNYKGK